MAQTKKKRRRKHRGTQTGRVDSGRGRGRPKSRAEARAKARSQGGGQKASRFDQPPTWKGATVRGVVAAVIFVVLVVVVFQRPLTEALSFGAFMLIFYIPAGYYMDQFMWKRRERAKIRAAQARTSGQAGSSEKEG